MFFYHPSLVGVMRKYTSAVVLNLFCISYAFIKQDHQIYPNTLNGPHLLKKTKLTNSYSLE